MRSQPKLGQILSMWRIASPYPAALRNTLIRQCNRSAQGMRIDRKKKRFPLSEINDCDLQHIPSCCSKLLTVCQHTCTFVSCCLCSHLRPTNQLQLNITKSQSNFSIFFSSSSVFSSHIHVLNN